MTAGTMNRDEALMLLPFAANGSLTRAEARAVEAWLEADADLRGEAAFLDRLRGMMQATPLPQTGAEFGLARLLKALPPQDLPNPAASPRRRMAWPVWATPALAASVAALVSMLGTAALIGRPREAPTEAPVYEQASGDATDLPVLTVSFRPDAALADVAALLQANDLLIVDGPGALGLYRLELPPGADALAMAEVLRAADTLVLSVDDPQ